MLKRNVNLVLERIAASDLVLDIGGWFQPFNRADYVLDLMPYETRGFLGSLGPEKEYFAKDTWIIHDVSMPLPFRDKEIDFVICSHTLEDIRDPIHLCSEIIRIGKAGYIEVPSRTMESIMGLEGRHYAGYYHHRWLVDIKSSEILFRFKPHLLHESWKFHFPKSYLKTLSEDERVSWIFWENTFEYKEAIQISELKIAQELETFVRHRKVYPALFYLTDSMKEKMKIRWIAMIKGILREYPRLRMIAERFRGRSINIEDEHSFWLKIPEIHSN